MIQVDSLIANEFEVLLEGEKVAGVFRVFGLSSFRLDIINKDASVVVREPFQISKMVQRDGNNGFNKWLRETVANRDSDHRPRRTLAILAVDDGVEIRRWTVQGAYISAVAYSAFDSASSELVEEMITIHYDDIEETWPSTANLE